jgi:LysR family nod box-dependent transcriptional activator
VRFRGLDLNLLIALDMLLEVRNVSRAARRLHMSQSTLSGALSRLRAHFGDELLVPSGRQLVATALADSLREPLREAVGRIESVVSREGGFDPARSQRHFRIELPDYAFATWAPMLLSLVAAQAPQVVLEMQLPGGNPGPLLRAGDLDVSVAPLFYADPAFAVEPLSSDRMVLTGWRGNPRLQQAPDLRTIKSLRQVVVRVDRSRLAPAVPQLELELFLGEGRVATVAPHFSYIPACLVGTAYVAVLHRRLVNAMQRALPLVSWELPLGRPAFVYRDVAMVHPVKRHDAGIAWLLAQCRAAVAACDA